MKNFNEFVAENYKKGKGKSFQDDKFIVKNLKMNDEVYKLRRMVMDFVYRAKKLTENELPRITVRISEISVPELIKTDVNFSTNSNAQIRILGVATMGNCEIWISEGTIKNGYDLQWVTYHEILHAAYGIPHIPESPLMKPYTDKEHQNPALLDDIFLSHVNTPDPKEWVKKYGKKYAKKL